MIALTAKSLKYKMHAKTFLVQPSAGLVCMEVEIQFKVQNNAFLFIYLFIALQNVFVHVLTIFN